MTTLIQAISNLVQAKARLRARRRYRLKIMETPDLRLYMPAYREELAAEEAVRIAQAEVDRVRGRAA